MSPKGSDDSSERPGTWAALGMARFWRKFAERKDIAADLPRRDNALRLAQEWEDAARRIGGDA